MIWSVPRLWEGETAVILAGGPSLREFDASILRPQPFGAESFWRESDKQVLRDSGWPVHGPRVITINDSWRLAPWADILYFCDASWWHSQVQLNRWSLDRSATFRDVLARGFWVKGCAEKDLGLPDSIHCLKFTGQMGLSSDPTALRHGSNSGYAAINLAYLLGAKRILLLGYDMHVSPKGSHWHQELRRADFALTLKRDFLPLFQTLVEPLKEAGVEVLNCTPGSALKCWPYQPLEEALKQGALQYG